MRKQLLLCSVAAVAITTALSGPVAAADLPLKAAPAPAPALYAPNWAGLYVGGHIGHGWGRFQVVETTDPEGILDRRTLSGLALGLHAGYNWQVNQWVFGIEGDATIAPWQKTIGGGDNTTNLRTRVDHLASIRGRLGWAFDRTLIYATGGLGFVQAHSELLSSAVQAARFSKTGGVVGGGIEWKYNPNFSLRLEGLHYFFNKTVSAGSFGDKLRTVSVIRVGASWHPDAGGGWGKGPVATRY